MTRHVAEILLQQYSGEDVPARSASSGIRPRLLLPARSVKGGVRRTGPSPFSIRTLMLGLTSALLLVWAVVQYID